MLNKKDSSLKQFTQNTLLSKILIYDNLRKILEKYNLPCLNCPMRTFEIGELKIGNVCKMYNIDLNNLLRELNSPNKK